jgi:PKD repeat protein
MFLRVCIILFSLLCYSSLFGQITITTSDMPKDGDTIRYSNAAGLGSYSFNQTGAQYTWDFTSLTHTTQGVSEYVQSSKTPYILNFGFSAIGLKIADTIGIAPLQFQNVYSFYRNSSSSFTIVGTGFQYATLPLPQSGRHSDPDEVYTFPLTYGDSNTTTFDVKVDLKAGFLTVGSYIQQGSRTTVVDGYGKISTPYAKDVDCIRVKSVIEGFDSVAVTTPAINFGTDTRRIEYRWLSKTERIPMLEVQGTEIAGNFVPNTIRYRDTFRRSILPSPLTADFRMTPDPAVDEVTLVNQSQGFFNETEWVIEPSTFIYGHGGTQEDSVVILFNDTGIYSIKLLVSSPFFSDSVTKSLRVNGSLSSRTGFNAPAEHLFYPNPTAGLLYVNSTGYTPNRIEIWTSHGVKVESLEWKEHNRVIDLRKYPAGMYYIHAKSDNISTKQKIIIE